jgi:hypothetical protein
MFYDLRYKFRHIWGKTQKNKKSYKIPDYLDSILTHDGQENEGKLIDKSMRRTLELSRKGIFACPQFTRLFNNDDEDIRIY